MKNILITLIFFASFFPILIRAQTGKNELRVTLQSSLISLDPGGIQDSQSLMVSRQVNCQFVRNQGSTYSLDAAESIKYVTPLKIILKINKNAKFHDHSPVTAEDVLASFNYIKEFRPILSNLFVWIDKIKIEDDKTILFSLKKQVPQFLKVLSATNFNIFKKEFLDKARKDKSVWKKPLGCGGYKVSEISNEYIKLAPVSRGLPITFRLIKSNQVNASDLGMYDIISMRVIGKSSEINDFNVIEMFDPVQFYVGLNSKSKLWKNKYHRCRFLAELDTKRLVSSYGESAKEANDVLPKGILGYNPSRDFKDQIIDISKKSSHVELNSKSPFCLAYLTVSVQDKNKPEYVNMFKSIYPNMTIKPITNTKKFGKDFVNDKCDALVFAWKSYYLDGYEYLTFFEDNDANFTGSTNPTFTNRILKSQDISKTEARAKEYQEIIKVIGEQCIIRPLLTLPTRNVYVRKGLKTPGIGLITIHEYYLGNVSRDDSYA